MNIRKTKVNNMIYYKIGESFEELESIDGYNGNLVKIVSNSELKEMLSYKEVAKDDIPNYKNAQCCRAKVHPSLVSVCFSTVTKDKKMNRRNFGFIIKSNEVIFIDNSGFVRTTIKKIKKNKFHGGTKIGRFLYDFLETVIESDLRYLEEMGDRLIKMESALIRGIVKDFSRLMADFKKEMLMFYRYYTQLVDLGDELIENENRFFSQDEINLFEKYVKRAERLREETQFLRETSNQLRGVYSSQLDAKQNKIMKVLTVVTTVFMPLSISTAWYGMNFFDMPELTWKWGYEVFILGNLLIIILCVWYLKKKKFL